MFLRKPCQLTQELRASLAPKARVRRGDTRRRSKGGEKAVVKVPNHRAVRPKFEPINYTDRFSRDRNECCFFRLTALLLSQPAEKGCPICWKDADYARARARTHARSRHVSHVWSVQGRVTERTRQRTHHNQLLRSVQGASVRNSWSPLPTTSITVIFSVLLLVVYPFMASKICSTSVDKITRFL